MARRKSFSRKFSQPRRRRVPRKRRSVVRRRSPVQTVRIVIEQPQAALPMGQKIAALPRVARFP